MDEFISIQLRSRQPGNHLPSKRSMLEENEEDHQILTPENRRKELLITETETMTMMEDLHSGKFLEPVKKTDRIDKNELL